MAVKELIYTACYIMFTRVGGWEVVYANSIVA